MVDVSWWEGTCPLTPGEDPVQPDFGGQPVPLGRGGGRSGLALERAGGPLGVFFFVLLGGVSHQDQPAPYDGLFAHAHKDWVLVGGCTTC